MGKAPTTLIVNADDFGLSQGINRGIHSSFREGILRSASLMPNGRAFEDALQIAGCTPGLGVGIHLSLVDEPAIASPDRLRGMINRDGRLPQSYPSFLKDYFLRRFGLEEIRAEIEAQIKRVLETGLKPTHLDSHQHLHLIVGIFNIVLQAARSAGIQVIRIPQEKGMGTFRRFSPGGIQKTALTWLCRICARKARKAGIRFVDHFWGLGVSGHLDERNLKKILASLQPGVNEIMSHPGFEDAETRGRYPWNYCWEKEAAALRSEAVFRFIEGRKIRLAHFGNAWDPGNG